MESPVRRSAIPSPGSSLANGSRDERAPGGRTRHVSERDVLAHVSGERMPVTVDSMIRDLEALGLERGMTAIVHTSMSRLGWVSGGAQAIIEALETVLGARGNLVMPTHSTQLTDPARWQNPPVPEPWWPIIRKHVPAFDDALTTTRGMGVVAETFRRQPGAVRSAHPHVSFAARGPASEYITARHLPGTGFGDESPLARVYELEGQVLLLGVDHGNDTSLHLAEARAEFPGKRVALQGAPMRVNGRRKWIEFEELDFSAADFAELGDEFAAETGRARQGDVGWGEGRLAPQRALVDYGVSWIEAHRS
jgi:aminoglycoside 3-N-acetyltransferase